MTENNEQESLKKVATFFDHMMNIVADEAEKKQLTGPELLGFFCQSLVSFCLAGGMELNQFKDVIDQLLAGFEFRLQQSLEQKLKQLKSQKESQSTLN